MKIRNGFVSNSSSSSFCLYGTTVGEDFSLLKFFCGIKKWFPEQYKRVIDENTKDMENTELKEFLMNPVPVVEPWDKFEVTDERENATDELEESLSFIDYDLQKETGIEYYRDYGAIGRPYKNADDNMTFKQFKDETKKIIDDICGGDNKCGHMEEAWRDG
jgi:hypothetical protein